MNKQDKEKARELARLHQGTMTDSQYLQMTYALEEMAAWKDKQLSKCLEKLEKEYIRNSGKGLYNNNEIAAKLATLKRIEEEMK